ncbi:5'-nucleotidase, lipoprotein e(P4) family [Pseudomonas farris]
MKKPTRFFCSLAIAYSLAVGSAFAEGTAVDVKIPLPETTAGASSGHLENNNVNALIWLQTSAEARALFYQAFNLGEMILDKALADKSYKKKPAVVVDIDETILENGPYLALLALHGTDDYPFWDEWAEAADAVATPGSVEFLNAVAKKDVDIFYVSNRYLENLPGTLKNLQKLGFPQVEESHLLFMDRNGSSTKEPRRQKVSQTHDIVLLMGDNLIDLSKAFEMPTSEERNKKVDELKDQFGKRLVILPNPTYGFWLDHLKEGYGEMSAEQKREARLRSLEYWKTDLLKVTR